ncbi:MAG: isoprenylcysteine carboxylmethyltransferase family protein [Candidatus Marinimicrobia bacterium]|nr:isoprenylcysteine carboxylmethyltransferase family protein [Candidatus Neomarinimicrobiota bacterium]
MQFFDYFQIFGILFFLLVFGGRTLYLRFWKNINTITLGVGKKGVRQIVEILFFFGLVAWTIEVLMYALSVKFHLFHGFLEVILFDSIFVKGVGLLLIALSFVLFVWALVSFGDSWRVGIDTQKPGELVKSGAFAVSRNPIFVFLDLYFIGTFLVNGAVVFLLFAVLIVLGLHYQILQEENYLKKRHSAAYETYCAQTNRYFGSHR